MDVDPVYEWSGNFAAIARHLIRRATAFAAEVAEIAAGAGVHRRDQLEARGEFRLARGARNRHAPGLERLAQHLQHFALELRQLVQEQHAMMGERNLAGTRIAAAADQGHAGSGVVRRAKRPATELLDAKPARTQRL